MQIFKNYARLKFVQKNSGLSNLMAKNLCLAISRVLWEWSPVSHACCRHSWAVSLFSLILIRSFLMKSLPSSLTFLKASLSNSQSQLLTFFSVSMSLAPREMERKGTLVIEFKQSSEMNYGTVPIYDSANGRMNSSQFNLQLYECAAIALFFPLVIQFSPTA